MKQKRIRINLEDTEGAKFKFDIEGNVTKDKVLKLFELMDLMNIEEEQTPDLDSVGGKIWNVVENHFPAGKFTSSDVLEKYEDEYNEPIKLSIVSTYLARFASRNRIERATFIGDCVPVRPGRSISTNKIVLKQLFHQPRNMFT